MAGTYELAWQSAGKSFRSFSMKEYGPLVPLLLVSVLYLILGLNLGSALGMATAGTISRWIAGPGSLDYPAFLQLLPLTLAYVETVVFVLGGAVALPLLVAIVLERQTKGTGPWRARARAAILPTLLALGAAYALVYLWQKLAGPVVLPFVRGIAGGGPSGAFAAWMLGSLVSLAVTTLVVYVPVVGVADGGGVGRILRQGTDRGRRFFGPTFLFVLLFSLPAILVQFTIQFLGPTLAIRTRPENIAYALLAYAVLNSLATYFVWSAATRVQRGLAASNGGIV